MGRTRKVGSAGRFGTRYGTKVRHGIKKMESEKSKNCPQCLKDSIKRESAGIWKCEKCGLKIAGKAYSL